ncbi:MAG: hypothetical protein ACTSQG_06460 [Promethearchaeota archaeon]
MYDYCLRKFFKNKIAIKADLKRITKISSNLVRNRIYDFIIFDIKNPKHIRIKSNYEVCCDPTKNKHHHGTKMRLIYRKAKFSKITQK